MVRLLVLVAFCAYASAGALRDAFNQRCDDFLRDAAGPGSGDGTWADLARLAQNIGVVHGDGLRSSMKDMWARKDCSDFDVTAMIRMLWAYGNSSQWPAGLAADVKKALLGWQYWIDEPFGFQGNMMFWTENHQSLCACLNLSFFLFLSFHTSASLLPTPACAYTRSGFSYQRISRWISLP